VPEILISYISSVIPGQESEDLSTLRLHKLATIHTSSLVRYLGVVDGPTGNIVAEKLKVFLAL
jgi:hypothetical protein